MNKGISDGAARAASLSSNERKRIAKAGAEARWKERSVSTMEHVDRLTAALFDQPGREHLDVKFCVGTTVGVSEETFRDLAADVIEQMNAGVGADDQFAEDFQPREVAEFISSC
jgi:hypothetical protein